MYMTSQFRMTNAYYIILYIKSYVLMSYIHNSNVFDVILEKEVALNFLRQCQ